jgi:uncharacterized protein (DUF2236 family)
MSGRSPVEDNGRALTGRVVLDLVSPAVVPLPIRRRSVQSARPGDGALLRHYAGDWRSILEGTSIGLLQLMYPPLGAAVAAQSGFFDDPYGRIYRSIPQIWATILAPDADARARRIRNLHRDIRGTVGGSRFSALDPETFWWAHATFTHLILRSVERYHRPGELDDTGFEHLYLDTVAWYERYGVSMRTVPPSLSAFRTEFDRFCVDRLEVTEAVERLLDLDARDAGTPTAGNALARFTSPIQQRWGRLSTIGNLPPIIRDRIGFAWTDDDERRLDRLVDGLRWTFELMPPAVNRATFTTALRRTGRRTRSERYQPTRRAA